MLWGQWMLTTNIIEIVWATLSSIWQGGNSRLVVVLEQRSGCQQNYWNHPLGTTNTHVKFLCQSGQQLNFSLWARGLFLLRHLNKSVFLFVVWRLFIAGFPVSTPTLDCFGINSSNTLLATRKCVWEEYTAVCQHVDDTYAVTNWTVTLTTWGIDGVPQLSVLPLAQLVLLGPGSSLGGLDLWTSNTGNRQEGRRESATKTHSSELWDTCSRKRMWRSQGGVIPFIRSKWICT